MFHGIPGFLRLAVIFHIVQNNNRAILNHCSACHSFRTDAGELITGEVLLCNTLCRYTQRICIVDPYGCCITLGIISLLCAFQCMLYGIFQSLGLLIVFHIGQNNLASACHLISIIHIRIDTYVFISRISFRCQASCLDCNLRIYIVDPCGSFVSSTILNLLFSIHHMFYNIFGFLGLAVIFYVIQYNRGSACYLCSFFYIWSNAVKLVTGEVLLCNAACLYCQIISCIDPYCFCIALGIIRLLHAFNRVLYSVR